MRSSARSALAVNGCAPGWLISIKRQNRSGRSGDRTSQDGSSNSANASANVGKGFCGSSCARAHKPAMRVSNSIAAQSNNTLCSNGERPSRSVNMASAEGGSVNSALVCVTGGSLTAAVGASLKGAVGGAFALSLELPSKRRIKERETVLAAAPDSGEGTGITAGLAAGTDGFTGLAAGADAVADWRWI